ncbi:MAG: hypothetical protein SFW67_22175 [Myxococcaceae bacterium]|nr:hypothetical protein [Myxococcaceae bacterium]
MAPFAVVVLTLASTPTWLPATGLVALTRSGGVTGGEGQLLAQRVLWRQPDSADGLTVAVGLRGALAENEVQAVRSGGVAFRLGSAVFDRKSPTVPVPVLQGWLQVSVGVGAFTLKDAPLAPGVFRVGPTARVEAAVALPPLAFIGLFDVLGVFFEHGPAAMGQDLRVGVMLGLSL